MVYVVPIDVPMVIELRIFCSVKLFSVPIETSLGVLAIESTMRFLGEFSRIWNLMHARENSESEPSFPPPEETRKSRQF